MINCQHCQTWILDDQHRCDRCGRRVRSTPFRNVAPAFPVTVTAAAPAYTIDSEPVAQISEEQVASPEAQQRTRLSQPAADKRVIPFDSLKTQVERREASRARAAQLARPAPLKTETVQVRHARSSKARGHHQRKVEFLGKAEVLTPPRSHIICDAPVAPVILRLEAALTDVALMLLPCALGLGLFWYLHGTMGLSKQTVPFLVMAIATVPLLYKLLWTFAGCDTIGMRRVGLQLVDFDGNPPSQTRRYLRLFGGILSCLAAGIGLVWSLVDEDHLTWHDHISGTFPTLASEN